MRVYLCVHIYVICKNNILTDGTKRHSLVLILANLLYLLALYHAEVTLLLKLHKFIKFQKFLLKPPKEDEITFVKKYDAGFVFFLGAKNF